MRVARMRNAVESRVRGIALVLTGVLLLQLAWSGARLLLLSEPDPIDPAASALKIEPPGYRPDVSEGETPELVARPLFWPGRPPFVPAQPSESPPEPEPEPEPEVDDSVIEGLKLLGVYAGGDKSGIIVADGGEQRRLSINDSIEGWKFILMSADGAIFEKGNESRMLRLEHALPGGPKAGQARGQQRDARYRSRKSNNGGD